MIFVARRTGGRFFKVSSAESLRASYANISDELRTQYYLAYYPKGNPDNEEFRKIEIRVNDPNYTVRARERLLPSK